MGSNTINPDYRNLLAIEKSRTNSMGLHENRKHNNYIKAIISVFAVAVLLSTMGVPIYNGIYAMESNALPYDMGAAISTGNGATSGHAEDLIYYEIYNWGQFPSSQALEHMVIHILIGYGLEFVAAILSGAWAAFYAAFAFTIAGEGLTLAGVMNALIDGVVATGASLDPVTILVIASPLLAA